jgi:hypothetical protein
MTYNSIVKEEKPKMNSLIVTPRRALKPNNGLNLRLNTIKEILVRAGYTVEIISAQQIKKNLNLASYDVCVIHTSTQLINYFRIAKLSSNFWFDCTDSIFRMRFLGLGRIWAFSHLKGFFEIGLAILLSRKFYCVTYISKLDLFSDRVLFQKASKLVFPNSVPNLPSSPLTSDQQEIYFVGDFSYNANRRAFKFIEKSVRELNTKEKCIFVLVSDRFTKDKVVITKRGQTILYRSHVPIERLYNKNAVHISPIWNNVGIKNKVFEPASFGVRTFGSKPSFNGLIMKNHMRSVENKKDFFPGLIDFIVEVHGGAILKQNVIELDQTTKIIGFLENLEYGNQKL